MVGQISVKCLVIRHFNIEWHCQKTAHLKQHDWISALAHRYHQTVIAFVAYYQTVRFGKGIRQIKQWFNMRGSQLPCGLGIRQYIVFRCYPLAYHDCPSPLVAETELGGTSVG